MRTIEERTAFLPAVNFTDDEKEEMASIYVWAQLKPAIAAQYIVWLELRRDGDKE